MNALQMSNDLILIFQQAKPGCATIDTGAQGLGGDEMCCCLRMHNGVLQTLSCGVWTDVPGWDNTQIAPSQPGNGSTQPQPGSCQIFQGKISPVEPWLLPVPVSSGDTIEISNLYGAWSPSALTTIWDCPDGNLFFAGNCIDGTSSIDSGAPDPTAPLNGTVIFDGTNYYNVSAAANVDTPVTITILPGVSVSQALVRCNFHGGVDPSGEVTFTAKVCNNQTASWTHTFDFETTNGGFVEDTSSGICGRGHWVPGSGWESDWCYQSADNESFRGIVIQLTSISSFNIVSASANFDLTKSGSVLAGTTGVYVSSTNGGVNVQLSELLTAMSSGSNQNVSGSNPHPAQTALFAILQCGSLTGNSDPGGSCRLKSITVTGTGINPFVGP